MRDQLNRTETREAKGRGREEAGLTLKFGVCIPSHSGLAWELFFYYAARPYYLQDSTQSQTYTTFVREATHFGCVFIVHGSTTLDLRNNVSRTFRRDTILGGDRCLFRGL
jgi:hypothetical protein